MVDDQATEFPDTVTVLKASNGSVVYLVGTAHFSKESQEDVAQVINAVKPEVVVIELCQSRKSLLTIDESTISDVSDITLEGLKQSIKQFGLTQGIFYQLMINLTANISRNLGMIPGGEFRRAVVEAKKYESCIYLGDRPVDITIKRVISMLSWPKCIKLLAHLLFTGDFKITKDDVEKFKNKDLLESLMLEMAVDYPELEKVIVDERDKFLAYSLQGCAGIVIDQTGVHTDLIGPKRPIVVVGVVGLGHVAGIKNYWETITKEEISKLIIIPPQSRSSKVIKVIIKVSTYGLLLWGFSKIPGVKSLSKITYDAITSTYIHGEFMKLTTLIMYNNNQMEDSYDHVDNSLIYSITNIPGPGCNMNDFNSCPNQMCNCTDSCHTPSCECVDSVGYNNYDDFGKLISFNRFIYECNDLCMCTTCQNRVVQLGPRIGLYISRSCKGLGLYTNIVIEKGHFVCEYAGEIIDIAEAQRRSNSDNENYIFVINEHFSDHIATTVIDATVIGNIGRYINHSCEPNCVIIPVRVDSLIPRLAIFAIKNIQCNEEITYHYGGEGFCSQNNLSEVKCLCESFSCNGFLPRKTGLF